MVDNKAVILDLRSSTYLTTNVAGAHLWTLLQEESDREHLVSALLDSYDVDAAMAAVDVDRFVNLLASRGLLEGEQARPGRLPSQA